VDAAGYAAESRMSVEEAARHLRYKALEEAAQAWDREYRRDARGSACRIAVAHHLEDQAETVLFNLVRGSRLRGLQGMLPVNGRIIRPLLTCSRAQIEEYLTRRGILWREDETNRDTRYARNLLRLQVMPLLEEINKEAGAHIARAAEEAAQAESFLREETERAAARCCRETEAGLVLSAGTLLREPALIGRRVVYEAIASAAGRKKDLQDTHVQAVLGLARKSGSGRVDVYSGVRVVKSYDDLLVCKAQENPAAQADPQTFPSGAASDVRKWPLDAAEYRCRVLDFDGDLTSVPRKQYTKWLDYDRIKANPVLRTRHEGDRLVINAGGGTKSLSDYFTDRKVPRMERDKRAVIADGSLILWIVGDRLGGHVKVTGETKRVLRITAEPL
jgi:tRNA(Ile)-lysidine synthase